MTGPELMRRDVHPAEVLMPDGSLHLQARVFVTSQRLIAYTRDREGRIVKALELALAGDPPVASRASLNGGNLELATTAGAVIVNQGAGCGCGSPLKALGTPVSWTA